MLRPAAFPLCVDFDVTADGPKELDTVEGVVFKGGGVALSKLNRPLLSACFEAREVSSIWKIRPLLKSFVLDTLRSCVALLWGRNGDLPFVLEAADAAEVCLGTGVVYTIRSQLVQNSSR